MTGASVSSPDGWKQEVVTTLGALQEVRLTCDSTELLTVRYARKAGLSWTEIAGALGVTRQSAWERWHELDETLPDGEAWGPFSLNGKPPERYRSPDR
jgi:hypothetical protein